MLVEEEHCYLRRVQQFVNLRPAISFGLLREPCVACLPNPVSLVHQKKIELHLGRVPKTHVPGKHMPGAAKLRLKSGRKGLAAGGVRSAVLLLQHLGKQLHSDDGFSGSWSS